MRQGQSVLQGAEAILSPDGCIHDAEPPAQGTRARQILREAAVRMDRARVKSRVEEPERVTEHWHALVAGRWSLVDEFDSDGRRFIVARRNDLGASNPLLSSRERQVAAHLALGQSNKEIAYQLGVSISTVSTHAHRIATKLGAETRIALVENCVRYVKALTKETS